jgi:hypothetical protein
MSRAEVEILKVEISSLHAELVLKYSTDRRE